MKLKVCRELHARMNDCAAAIDETLTDWVRRCVAWYRKGAFAVAQIEPELLFATRDAACITVGECGMSADELRRVLAAGVEYAEGRRVVFRKDIDTGERE